MSIGSSLGAIVKAGHTAWNLLRNPKKSIINLIIKSLNIGKEHFKEYLFSKVADKTLSFAEGVYWEEKKLHDFFLNMFDRNKTFGFEHCNAEELSLELEQFLVVSGHQLSEAEKVHIVTQIISFAKEYYLEKQVNDAKAMNQIQLRQGITLKQILAAVATLPSLKEQINEIQTQLNNKDFVSADETGEKGFQSLYTDCILLYNRKEYNSLIGLLEQALNNTELNNEERIALFFLQSGVYYNQYNYDVAYEKLICIEDLDLDRNTQLKLSYLALKGSVLSEKGLKESNTQLTKLGTQCFEQQLQLVQADECDNHLLWSIYYNLGTSYMSVIEKRDELELCIQYFELALEIDDTNPELLKNLGTVYGWVHAHDKEIAFYQRSLEINPDLLEALCAMGYVQYAYFNEPVEALSYYKRALRQHDQLLRFPAIFYWVAKCYIELNDWQNAFESIEKGLRYNPTSKNLYELKAEILFQLQIQNSARYLELFVQHVRTYHQYINADIASKVLFALVNEKRFQDAEQFLEALEPSLRNEPDMINVYTSWMIELQSNGEYEKAEMVINNIDVDRIDSRRHLTLYYFVKSRQHIGFKQYEQALQTQFKLIECNTYLEERELLCFIGETYLLMEDFNEARKNYQRAKRLSEQNYFDVEIGLCKSYTGLGRTTPAKLAIENATQLLSFVYVSKIVEKYEGNTTLSKEEIDQKVQQIYQSVVQLAWKNAEQRLLTPVVDIKNDREALKALLDEHFVQFGVELSLRVTRVIGRTAFNFQQIANDMVQAKIHEVEKAFNVQQKS